MKIIRIRIDTAQFDNSMDLIEYDDYTLYKTICETDQGKLEYSTSGYNIYSASDKYISPSYYDDWRSEVENVIISHNNQIITLTADEVTIRYEMLDFDKRGGFTYEKYMNNEKIEEGHGWGKDVQTQVEYDAWIHAANEYKQKMLIETPTDKMKKKLKKLEQAIDALDDDLPEDLPYDIPLMGTSIPELGTDPCKYVEDVKQAAKSAAETIAGMPPPKETLNRNIHIAHHNAKNTVRREVGSQVKIVRHAADPIFQGLDESEKYFDELNARWEEIKRSESHAVGIFEVISENQFFPPIEYNYSNAELIDGEYGYGCVDAKKLTAEGTKNLNIIMNYLMSIEMKIKDSKGNVLRVEKLQKFQAAGLAGNFMRESGCLPTALNKSSGAYGIAQWIGVTATGAVYHRRKILENMFGKNPSLIQQLNFVEHELNTTHKSGWTHLVASKTTREAARMAMGYYEFSAGPEGAIRDMNKYNQDGEGAMEEGIANALWIMDEPCEQVPKFPSSTENIDTSQYVPRGDESMNEYKEVTYLNIYNRGSKYENRKVITNELARQHIGEAMRNLWVPIRKAWNAYMESQHQNPSWTITSGYRPVGYHYSGGGTQSNNGSAHIYGYAIDVQPYFTDNSSKRANVKKLAAFIKSFLSQNRQYPFDQILVEYTGNFNTTGSAWVHIGYRRPNGDQRREYWGAYAANAGKGQHGQKEII